ncbi:hypothetical protein Caci_4350 [Catenulispora acidiphila DSM 44928]|uniref:Uncharacterized protein n=1 Tax=Catenulispora acidiphila (strain DSM 44928 / JCM 14897 / NBRC 102108 / NRRL B-24433 / ID139908) TaxID=479433 RepID=C7QJX6_CATAD|nr:hypothetical protein [Catenulispora acidiphila]ACU73214.1 hypothetical protein Caci_4350 [Catenulispora acidiphila DSM 44928]
MASQKRPAKQSVDVSIVSAKEIVLIVLVMVVLAGTAASLALLG